MAQDGAGELALIHHRRNVAASSGAGGKVNVMLMSAAHDGAYELAWFINAAMRL